MVSAIKHSIATSANLAWGYVKGSSLGTKITSIFAKQVVLPSIQHPEKPVSLFREVFKDVGGQRKEFRDFLTHIFMQLDEDRFFTLIDSILQDESLTDEQIYQQLYDRIGKGEASKSKIQKALSILKSLKGIKNDLSTQVKQLMGKQTEVNGYVEIGYPGRLIRPLQRKLEITGPRIVIHDQERASDYVQTGIPRPYDRFIELNDYAPFDCTQIPSNSVDMVTCFIGLHHVPPEKLERFIGSIRRILRPGGTFILMDHDAKTKSLQQLAHVVHSVFNAATGVTPREEQEEVRNFRSLQYWTDLLQTHGFEHQASDPLIRQGDPTLNAVVRLTKTPQGQAQIEEVLAKTPGYKRAQLQTYLTMPEWHNVRVSQAYGEFIKHTPFYLFPYFQEIKAFWSVFIASWKAARQHSSFVDVAFSQYTMMNLFIGVMMTIEFLLKGIISAPIAKLYGSEQLKEPEVLQLLVRHTGKPLAEVDGRIRVVKEFPNTPLKHLEIPRYMPFKEIVFKLAEEGVECVNIAGQNKIQFDLLLTKGAQNPVASQQGCKFLYEQGAPADPEHRYVALEVEVEHLSAVVRHLKQQKIEISYIHDF